MLQGRAEYGRRDNRWYRGERKMVQGKAEYGSRSKIEQKLFRGEQKYYPRWSRNHPGESLENYSEEDRQLFKRDQKLIKGKGEDD